MAYHVSSFAYLKRARQRLDDGCREALFYAAFELRCGIEARSHEYLEPHSDIPRKQKVDYRINRLGRALERVSLPEDQVMRFRIMDTERNELATFFYTPVTTMLREKAGRLGDVLHAQVRFRRSDHKWWAEFRGLLESTFEELLCANSGSLLGAPRMKAPDGSGSLVVGTPWGLDVDLNERKGQKLIVNVEYLAAPPDEIVEELPTRLAETD